MLRTNKDSINFSFKTRQRTYESALSFLSFRHVKAFHILPQTAVERMACHGSGIAEDDKLHAGTGDCYVHATQITQESNVAIVVSSHKRY